MIRSCIPLVSVLSNKYLFWVAFIISLHWWNGVDFLWIATVGLLFYLVRSALPRGLSGLFAMRASVGSAWVSQWASVVGRFGKLEPWLKGLQWLLQDIIDLCGHLNGCFKVVIAMRYIVFKERGHCASYMTDRMQVEILMGGYMDRKFKQPPDVVDDWNRDESNPHRKYHCEKWLQAFVACIYIIRSECFTDHEICCADKQHAG